MPFGGICLASTFLKRKPKEPETPARRPVEVVYADPDTGLTSEQVSQRAAAGWANLPVEPIGKTTRQIVLDNIFTYFNLIFFILAICVILVGQWLNLTFMGVVIWNTLIGIAQELKSKKTLDNLSILNTPKAHVVRNGKLSSVATEELVRDDVVEFTTGNQIYADAEVIDGDCHVNEALITGESDEILKKKGDTLLSGSFVINGTCRARLTNVGADSFVSKLTIEAKKSKGARQSEMMNSLTNLIKWIGFIVIPLGIIMFIKEHYWLDREIAVSVTSTVGSIVGMIPEGLYLLTTLALVAAVIRLANKKTLVHDMDCIETLARVDILCVDKTGTITENKMVVEDVIPLCPDRYIESDIRLIMADYVYAMQNDNETMAALKRYFTGEVKQQAIDTLPFTSKTKYGGVSFHEDETYLLGAPEILLAGQDRPDISKLVEEYSSKGCRTILLGLYDGTLEDEELKAGFMPLALILLSNKVRAEAPETFRYFAKQGVQIKVISGDNAVTVSEVARRADVADAEKYIDARTLDTREKIYDAADKYTVFGRVTPEQKRTLVQALKEQGHKVAMTGDGVNDVLALKEADCSIAMASGSEVASQVSHIVLMDSNFSSMPHVVDEGRRVINNIERSASLYLVKNIFTFTLALITLLFTLPYPYSPAQLVLVNTFTIGVPSFVLAMEPNHSLVKGKFLRNVIFRALPAALTDLVLVIGTMLFYLAFGLDDTLLSTICTGIMGIVGLMQVYKTSIPFNTIRIIDMAGCGVLYLVCYFGFPQFFTLAALNSQSLLILIVLGLLAWPIFSLFTQWTEKIQVGLDDIHYKRGRHMEKRKNGKTEERKSGGVQSSAFTTFQCCPHRNLRKVPCTCETNSKRQRITGY